MSPSQPANGEQYAGLAPPGYPSAPGPNNGPVSSLDGYGQPIPGSEAPTIALPAGQSAYPPPMPDVAVPPLAQQQVPVKPNRRPTRIGAAWVALIVAAIVLIFLLIFIVQNSGPVQVRYFGFEGTMSLGVAMLFAAVAGALTAGLLGTVRILQMRKRAKKALAAK